MHSLRFFPIAAACLAVLLTACKTPQSQAAKPASGNDSLKLVEGPGFIRVENAGVVFTQLNFTNTTRPFLYPVFGPSGDLMARHWPMGEFPDEEHDHPHHKSIWFAHGDINGNDFWSEQKEAGTTVQKAVVKSAVENGTAVIKTFNELVSKAGKVVATEDRTMKFQARPGARIIDFEVTLIASHGALKLGDTKEGTMAIRLAETMRLKGKVGKGHIVNSAGVRDAETWGKRAEWCDYYGPVDGRTVGVAIFDHPSNFRHPTWWHVRDYGLFAANPFGISEFEKKPKGAGDHEIPAGGRLTFRYRLYFHNGDEQQGGVAQAWREYSKN